MILLMRVLGRLCMLSGRSVWRRSSFVTVVWMGIGGIWRGGCVWEVSPY